MMYVKFSGEFNMNISQKKKYQIFVWITISINIVFWGVAMITRGNTLDLYFSCDPTNSYMDYFNMLSNIEGLDPYYANANYPALAFVVWRILYRMVPWNALNIDGFFLRDAMAAQLGFILLNITCILLLWEIIKFYSKDTGIYTLLLPVSIIFSGPVLFTIERGNIIILAFLFSFLFIVFYDSEKKQIRYFAYFCLAIAAGIKMYPALLGMLVLSKKRYKESVFLVILGIVTFVVPFFAFDGIDSFLTMLNGISISSSDGLALGFGFNFSFGNLIRTLYGLTGEYIEEVSSIIYLIPFLVCILIYLLNTDIWKKVFALIIFMIWIPSFSYTYVLIFMIIPLVFFLKTEKKRNDYLYAVFFAVIMGTWCLPKLNQVNFLKGEEFKFYLTYGTILVNIVIALFSLLLIMDGVYNIFQRKKGENKQDNEKNRKIPHK